MKGQVTQQAGFSTGTGGGTGGVPGADRLTDRQAADAVRGRIDWKYALGMELTDPGFESPRSRGSGRAWLSTAWSMRCWM